MITKFCVLSLICGALGALGSLFGERDGAVGVQAGACTGPSSHCPQQIAMASVSAGQFFSMLAHR
ncbi:MAG: hypothetical protein JSR69_05195 [Proteobacteria bacterium]|nr:hypothetical protein [Pseudomonadota bacterium]